MTHLDPDPLHTPDDDLGVLSWERQRRAALRPARPWGCVVALLVWLVFWAIVITLVVHIVTPRSGQTTDRLDMSPTSSAAQSGAPPAWRTAAIETVGVPRPLARGAGTASAPAVVSGRATWYRWRPGQAAAGPRLRAALGSHWRGSVVRVCATACITVRLTDWCLCGYGRVVDLDARSFARLAPLSAGVLRVRVYLAGGLPQPARPRPTPPPTDVGP